MDGLEGQTLAFAILSIDIVGSTALASRLAPSDYLRLIVSFLHEFSAVVPLFHGHVLKYTGDGLIAYFPEPSFTQKNDLAVDCALTMRRLLHEAFNPEVEGANLPPLSVRIGIDAGDAYVSMVGHVGTKSHADVIGSVVNVATKIQGVAPPGLIYLGDSALRLLHTSWRQRTRPVALAESSLKLRRRDGSPYQLHELLS